VRVPDQPTHLDTTIAIASLIQALVASAEADGPADRGIYAQNRWAAARFGHEAELIHREGRRLAGVDELLRELLERVGPTAERLGGGTFLARLEGLAQADDQLAVGRRQGLRALCESLVSATYDGVDGSPH
jgi:carboxylate-amine ligase